MSVDGAEAAARVAGEAEPVKSRWTDDELLDLMLANAPQGMRPETMLPVLRGLADSGADPRAIVAAVKGARSSEALPVPARAMPASPGKTGGASPRRRRLRFALVILFWLAVWEIADRVVGNRLILTGPIRTLQALGEQAMVPEFWLISAASFGRISLGFVAAFLGGLLLAVSAHRWRFVGELLAPLMAVVKTVPMVSFIIMLLIWVGGQALTVWLAFLIVVPLVYTSMGAGLSAVDPRSIEMARVFRLSARKRFLYVYRPVFLPFLISASQVGLGMSWKAGIMAEVFATPTLSIGKEMFTAKTFLDTPALFAWTAVVMLLSLLFERLVMMLLRLSSRPLGGLLGSR